MKGLNIKSLQFKNFMSVGNVLQTVLFESGLMRVVTGEDLDAGKLKRSGIGKAQPLTSKVKTPYGWSEIGKLGVGDFVCTPSGSTTIINGVYPQGSKNVLRFKFEDGRVVEACDEHLWKVYTKNNGWEVVNSKKIQSYIKQNINVSIPLLESLSDNPNPRFNSIDPYLFGLFLACGSIEDGSDYIQFSTIDENIKDKIEMSMKAGYIIEKNNRLIIFDIDPDEKATLLNLTENEMLIDDELIYSSSYEQRVAMLSAFMDVYAYEENNYAKMNLGEYGKDMATCLQKLIFSLGGKCIIKQTLTSDEYMNTSFDYLLTAKFKNANVFFHDMSKKTFGFNNDMKLAIKSVTSSGTKDCVCISIISSDKLYITDNYVITHNTTVTNALSYCLYNKPVSDIKVNLLPNKTNKKGMYTKVEFEKDGVNYFIERGTKPDIFRFVKSDKSGENDFAETQGTKADTQVEIERVLGLSYDLFIMIVTINTAKLSFMKSPLSKQRDIIEEIFNISELTRKAKVLSEYNMKNTKAEMERESVRIETMINVRKRAEESLTYAQTQYTRWEQDKVDKIESLKNKKSKLENIDIDKEIESHNNNDFIKQNKDKRKQLINERDSTSSLTTQGRRRLGEIEKMLASFSESICPTCKQTITDDNHKEQEKQLEQEAVEYFNILDEAEKNVNEIQGRINLLEDMDYQSTHYNNIQEAYNHQKSIEVLVEKIEDTSKEVNPHQGSIDKAKENLHESEISYDHLEELDKKYKHQQFLQKILTGRDSFVRKRIIDVSIPLLNQQIEGYLKQTELSQEIRFNSDLTLEIVNRGEEYSFDSLSRGEQNWAIITLNLAMRDLFEQLTTPINILFVDELIDFGIDASSAVDAFNIIKNFARDRDKSVSLITHREELFEKADEILFTTMENGFTSYENRRN